ncbi:MAG: hypothetical protein IPG04_16025, partial [Polyangiaceae bacterium]|nr:hypothetical protein [Polyangiaceae bacterium]
NLNSYSCPGPRLQRRLARHCNSSCGFDVGGCSTCGDSAVSAGENCDGGNLQRR